VESAVVILRFDLSSFGPRRCVWSYAWYAYYSDYRSSGRSASCSLSYSKLNGVALGEKRHRRQIEVTKIKLELEPTPARKARLIDTPLGSRRQDRVRRAALTPPADAPRLA